MIIFYIIIFQTRLSRNPLFIFSFWILAENVVRFFILRLNIFSIKRFSLVICSKNGPNIFGEKLAIFAGRSRR